MAYRPYKIVIMIDDMDYSLYYTAHVLERCELRSVHTETIKDILKKAADIFLYVRTGDKFVIWDKEYGISVAFEVRDDDEELGRTEIKAITCGYQMLECEIGFTVYVINIDDSVDHCIVEKGGNLSCIRKIGVV